MEENHPKTIHPYRSFTGVVVIYLVGILAFSAWSYIEHRNVIESVSETESKTRKELINKDRLIESSEIAFLLVMAIPLILLFHRARTYSIHQVEELNAELQRDYEKLKKHEDELEDAIADLERFNAVTTGREERIIELKTEVNTLLEELNRPKRYTSTPTD